MSNKYRQGDIWLANLNPSKKTGSGKVRPVLIIQNQHLLDISHPSTIIIPLTTNLIDDAEPLRIRINKESKLKQDSDLLLDQIRAIDNSRLIEGPLLSVESDKLKKIIQYVGKIVRFIVTDHN